MTEHPVPILHCAACGFDSPSYDDRYCDRCGAWLQHTRNAVAVPDLEREAEDRDFARTAYTIRLIAELEELATPAPGTVAQLEARAKARRLNRILVHEMQAQGMSIAQTALRLKLKPRYVSELRAEPLTDD